MTIPPDVGVRRIVIIQIYRISRTYIYTDLYIYTYIQIDRFSPASVWFFGSVESVLRKKLQMLFSNYPTKTWKVSKIKYCNNKKKKWNKREYRRKIENRIRSVHIFSIQDYMDSANSRLPLSRDHIDATMLTSARAIYKRKFTLIKNRYFSNLH